MDGNRADDGLLGRLEALERENRAWRGETARLAHELEDLRALVLGAAVAGDEAGNDEDRVSRRGMLRLAAAAAAGAGAVAAGAMVGAQPALAGTDGDLALGNASNSASAPTGLAVSGSSSKYGIGVTDNGLAAYPNVEPPAALFGHANNANFQAGVVGYSDNGQYGVVGRSDPIDGTSRPGVYGVGQPGLYGFGGGTSPGVIGTGNGIGVEGVGEPGVQGTADGYRGTGVQGTNPGTVLGASTFPAQGIGVLAECTDGGAGPPAAASIALSARNDGSGTGVKATSASGIPIVGQITNSASAWPVVYAATNAAGPALKGSQSGSGYGVYSEIANTANSQPAVYGTTNGAGPAVRGTQTGTGYGVYSQIANTANSRAAVYGRTNGSGPAIEGAHFGANGNAVYGLISNASNAAAAVRGAGSSNGRGGMFSGGAAQLRLVPGGSVPAAGQTGDLFVDAAGHLHYCTAGGLHASWTQLA